MIFYFYNVPIYLFEKEVLLFLLFFASFNAIAQQSKSILPARTSVNLNQNWSFAKDPTKQYVAANLNGLKWATVQIPHTWNAFDVMDDTPGYYRGIGWYKKKLALKPAWKGKKLYLYFEGANQETTVYLNGKKAGHHVDGYNAFRVPLSNLKFDGTDEIAVKVDNSYNENIAPLTADFTFFGGIYRNVSLWVLTPVHFEDNLYASKGVYVHAEQVSKTAAAVMVNGNLINSSSSTQKLTIVTTFSDANGKQIEEVSSAVTAGLNELVSFKQPVISVKQPNLWSPEHPYLYQAKTRLLENGTGKVLDEVKVDVGLRFFSFDAEKGFFLNGQPYKLIGASRHQDFEGMGNAVPSALQVKDITLLKEMGGNFLRVAHYPQDQAVLDACDRMGILTSVEIPIVNEIDRNGRFLPQ
ncbi:glycoside hydrolase family 2 protein [Pedobacter sp. UC225_65]|uniref:glycoside hydrolase family 2 protein n=1 Tax=Pedobacter sp. UC225_65 TaxID=3350173 RepID=UPI00366CC909